MSNEKLKIIPMIDKSDSYSIKKDNLFDLPLKLAIIGKSHLSGKTTVLCSLLCFNNGYNKDFAGKNIYIVSPSINTIKMKNLIKYKQIPEDNLFNEYDEEILMELYDTLKKQYLEDVEENKKPSQKLIIFDDVGYSGNLRKINNGFIDLLACNGRHFLINSIVLVQKYTQLSNCYREALTGLICFSCSYNQLEFIVNEHNTSSRKKIFIKEFQKATKEKHSFFTINYSNDYDKRYMKNFDEYIKLD